jgi:hypothetical protein
MLDVVFALDRSLNLIVVFEVNKALDGIPLCKACKESVPVFIDSSNKIVGHPNVQDAVGALAMM